jgi:uracil-DNA glycosylase
MFPLKYPDNNWHEYFEKNSAELFEISNKIHNKINELENLEVYPPNKDIFKAFELCDIDNIKIVIIGQDCYHGKGQANGLCFSVNKDIKIPPSLRNIYKELKNDLNIERSSNDFSNLANQGVLLLNSSLTVHEKLAGSHLNIWENFTNNVINYISNASNDPIVFILWGNYAKSKKKFINDRHYIIEGTHPSPLSANRGGFFGNKYFSKANELLIKHNKTPINWSI